MSCFNHRALVVAEMQALADLIHSENSELEQQRNELKSQFMNRPTEEKKIVKDVLVIHSEFETGVSRVKEIIEEISAMPEEKVLNTAKAQEISQNLVVLQSELVKKHENLQKLVNTRQNYQKLNEDILVKSGKRKQELDKDKFSQVEIENYEHGNLYSKKTRVLNNEITRLRSLISSPFAGSSGDAGSELVDKSVSKLAVGEASLRLKDIQNENREIEGQLGKLNSRYLSKERFVALKREVDEKGRKVDELKKVLNSLNDEIKNLNTPNSPRRKISFLNTLVGRRSPLGFGDQLSPRSKLKSNTLLKDIEESLKRVKSISFPTPKQ